MERSPNTQPTMSSQQPYYNAASSPPVVQGVLVSNNKPNENAPGHIYDHHHVTHGIGAAETPETHHQNIYGSAAETGHWTKGEVQPRKCNDFIFAILFWAHLGVVGWAAGTFAPRMYQEVAEANDLNRNLEEGLSSGLTGKFMTWIIQGANRAIQSSPSMMGERSLEEEENYDISGTNDFADMMLLLGISTVVAVVISTLTLGFMIRYAQALIKFALLFNIAATVVVSSLFL